MCQARVCVRAYLLFFDEYVWIRTKYARNRVYVQYDCVCVRVCV